MDNFFSGKVLQKNSSFYKKLLESTFKLASNSIIIGAARGMSKFSISLGEIFSKNIIKALRELP